MIINNNDYDVHDLRWQSGTCKLCGEHFDCHTHYHAETHGYKDVYEYIKAGNVKFDFIGRCNHDK